MEKKENPTVVEGPNVSAPAQTPTPPRTTASGSFLAANPDQPGQTGAAQQRTRRTDARRGLSEKITVCALDDGSAGAVITTGWALNMSRSGIRAILEERVLAGVDYEVTIGEVGTSQLTRRARVVWVQEEHDGVVVGLEFLVAMAVTAPPGGGAAQDGAPPPAEPTKIDLAPLASDDGSDDDKTRPGGSGDDR
ncbi:MAG: PilZ domain-containing protein [Polyangiaceae bacterium]